MKIYGGELVASGSATSIPVTGLATTGSNTFNGNQTFSGSLIPSVNGVYDLGSATHEFRHLYLSSASLYIDGTKVLGSTTQELQITTDTGQSFKILEAGSDTITLQSADGNITLATSGGGDVILDPTNGVIALKGTTTVYSGFKIISSDGNNIHLGNGLTVTGSIVSTVTPLVSGSAQITYSGLSGVPSGIISGSSQLSGFGFATTGSNTLIGNQTVNGNLIVTGSLTAQQFIVSSSVTHLTTSFSSGSQKFGDTLDDTHQFTGSVLVTGSLTVATTGTEFQVNEGGVNLGNALTDNHIISGSVRFNSNSLFVSSSGDLGIGTTTLSPATELTLGGSQTALSAIARGQLLNTTLLAAANNDTTVGLEITPTYTNGAFTGVTNIALRLNNAIQFTGTPTNAADVNVFYNNSSASTICFIAGATQNSTSSVGSFIAMRGNTYSAIANQRGTIFIGAGNPTTPTATEGAIRIYGGNNVEYVRQFANGNWVFQNGGTFTDAGFRLDIQGTGRFTGALTGTSATFSGTAQSAFLTVTQSGGQLASFNSTNANGGYLTWETTGATIADVGTAQQIFGAGGNNTFGINARGARSLSFGTNQTARFTLDSAGAATFSSSVTATSLTSSGDLFLTSTGAVVFNSATNFNTQIYHNSGALVFYTGASERARITSTGNMGIGLSSPASALDVLQEIRVSFANANQYRVRITNTDGNGRILVDGSESSLIFGTSPLGTNATAIERMRITAAGRIIINNSTANDSGDRNLTIQGSLSATNNDIASINLTQVWNGTSYPVILAAQQDLTYGNASGAFVLKTSYWNGSTVITGERLRVTSLGNVGIGTTAPASKLEVIGDTRAGNFGLNTDSVFRGGIYTYKGVSGSGTDYGVTIFAEGGTGNGNIYFCPGGSATRQVTITTDGKVGIGTTSPTHKFAIAGTSHTFSVNPHSSGIDIHSTGNIAPHYQTNFTWYTGAIGSGTQRAALDSSGNLSISGTLTESSALRYKENIVTLTSSLEKVLQMRGVSYNKKDTGIKEIGVIAEEMNEIVPDVVNKNDKGEIESVAYGRLVAIFIEALKEQQKQIEEIKALIK
jgi:archaeosine-15-forming tRNA-guanine transglycosylase